MSSSPSDEEFVPVSDTESGMNEWERKTFLSPSVLNILRKCFNESIIGWNKSQAYSSKTRMHASSSAESYGSESGTPSRILRIWERARPDISGRRLVSVGVEESSIVLKGTEGIGLWRTTCRSIPAVAIRGRVG